MQMHKMKLEKLYSDYSCMYLVKTSVYESIGFLITSEHWKIRHEFSIQLFHDVRTGKSVLTNWHLYTCTYTVHRYNLWVHKKSQTWLSMELFNTHTSHVYQNILNI